MTKLSPFAVILFVVVIVLSFGLGFQSGSKSKKIIATDKAPKAIGPYSQAVLVGDMLFVSGQLGIDPMTGKLVSDSTEAQLRQVMQNLGEILKAGDLGYADVVQASVFLKDMSEFPKMNAIYAEYFPSDPPARATVEVSRLPAGARVEISVIAVRERN